MPTFEEFVQTELPKRPFCTLDGSPGQILKRSTNPLHPLELEWGNADGTNVPTFIAAQTLSGHKAVILTAPGAVDYADNTTASHGVRVFGITLSAATMGDTTTVAMHGAEVVEPTWSWTTGLPIYLGTNGTLIQSEPVSPAVFSLIVGFATSPTSMCVNVREPIFLA